MLRQRTISGPVHAIGIGVHSARKVRLTLRPAPENFGVRFYRTDLTGGGAVPALAEQVVDTTLATTLAHQGVKVTTVEHLMSALWGLGIDNLIVELNAEEVPILDGSAAPFVYLIESAGILEQNAAKQFMRIRKRVCVSHGDATASLKPFDGFRAAYTFVADHPVYNRYPKRAVFDFGETSYVTEICRARSFGLVRELEQAQSIGRCRGSSLDNAVGIDDYTVLNDDGLRYEDEFVKHKLLDAIGDLYLLGRPVLGEFDGFKSGHALNNLLARAVLETADAWELVTVGQDEPSRPGAPILQPAARVVAV